MSWKQKEKELTRDEALRLAKQELAPFWFGSPPLIVGVRADRGFQIFQLNPDFEKKTWLIAIIDPTEFAGEEALVYLKEWHKRYSLFGIDFLILLSAPYDFFSQPELIQKMIEKLQVHHPLAIDVYGTLSGAFDARLLPKLVMLSQGTQNFAHAGLPALTDVEKFIQHFLREKDPGLALRPLYLHGTLGTTLGKRIEFGLNPKLGDKVTFPAPGFSVTPGEGQGDQGQTAQTGLSGVFPDLAGQKLKPGEVGIQGNWTQDHEKISTSDSRAALRFVSPSRRISLIAKTHSKTTELSTLSIEVQGLPAYDAIAGEHLMMDDLGQSIIKVKNPQLYHVLINLPEREREVTIRFPNAELAPVGLYGMRLGE